MSLVLSLCRARSSLFPLLVQGRRFHAYARACWIHPSESCQQTHLDEHSAIALLATRSLKPPVLSQQRLDHGAETMSRRRHLSLESTPRLDQALLL